MKKALSLFLCLLLPVLMLAACGQPAGEAALRALRRSLRTQARTLLRRAGEHLFAHRDEFPEYDPENDTLRRCTTDGGFVQIH